MTYRNDQDHLRRRIAELEADNAALQEKVDDVDVALLRAENERMARTLRGEIGRDRRLEVQAGKDRVARVFGAIALGIGVTFLAAFFFVVSEPGPVSGRLLLCLASFAIAPSAWGILRLVKGAERDE